MTESMDDQLFPTLFSHSLRKDWGLGIFAGEVDGKHRYLFENGGMKTLAIGFHQLLQKVDKPNAEQRATYARLSIARSPNDRVKTPGAEFLEQLARFRETYADGLSDAAWARESRGEGAKSRAPRHRQALLQEAQELLSAKALDALLSGQQFAQLWEQALKVVKGTDLVPIAQLKLRAPSDDQRRALAVALREMLHGTGKYEMRFDRFVQAFTVAFGEYPRWELATSFSAAVHPGDHVCVEPVTFRKQNKLSTSRRTVGAQPNSTGYTSFLSIARLIANKLAEQGEVPRDLFDARDFIVQTLKPIPKGKLARDKAKALRAAEASQAEASDDESGDDDASEDEEE